MCNECLLCACLYFLRDVQVAGVDAICEQILGAAALTGPEHTVVGLEKLTAGKPEAWTSSPTEHHDDVHNVLDSGAALPMQTSVYHAAKCRTHHCDLLQVIGCSPLSMKMRFCGSILF